jgi:hypothetical protein
MTIMLTPDTEARLREKAEREGQDLNVVAEALIAAALDWEAQDRAEAIEGVRRGDQAAAEGRERPLAAFLAEQRVRYGFPAEWPSVSVDDGREWSREPAPRAHSACPSRRTAAPRSGSRFRGRLMRERLPISRAVRMWQNSPQKRPSDRSLPAWRSTYEGAGTGSRRCRCASKRRPGPRNPPPAGACRRSYRSWSRSFVRSPPSPNASRPQRGSASTRRSLNLASLTRSGSCAVMASPA